MVELSHRFNTNSTNMRVEYMGRWLKGFKRFLEIGAGYNLSGEAKYRLQVIGYYYTKGGKKIDLTSRYFGLHRNTVGKWLKLYDSKNLTKLEPKKPVPFCRIRKKTPEQVIQKIIEIKRQEPYIGKEKMSVVLERDFEMKISPSTIGRIFKTYKLTYIWRNEESSCNYKKTIRKRQKKLRPPRLKDPGCPGKWIQIDTVVIYFRGHRVYVITAIDLTSRFAFAWGYSSPSSTNAKDFLNKLTLFFPGIFSIEMIQTDNGSEFHKYFDTELKELKIKHVWSKPKSPEMNGYVESFNNIIQRECLKRRYVLIPISNLNNIIIDYLIKYNTWRPHGSLDYKTPIEVYIKYWLNSNRSSFSDDSQRKNMHTMLWTHTGVEKTLDLKFDIA